MNCSQCGRFNSANHKCINSVEERFYNKVIPVTESGCFLWTGKMGKNGYGYVQVNNKEIYAHRLAWILANGEIPSRLCVCHHCDVPICVNVSHLFLGTDLDNNRDMRRKNRHRQGVARGEMNGNSKFTRSQIEEIRNLYAGPHPRKKANVPGKFQQPELARMFRTTQPVISQIVRGITWKE